MYTIQ